LAGWLINSKNNKRKDTWEVSFLELPKPDRRICRMAIVEKNYPKNIFS